MRSVRDSSRLASLWRRVKRTSAGTSTSPGCHRLWWASSWVKSWAAGRVRVSSVPGMVVSARVTRAWVRLTRVAVFQSRSTCCTRKMPALPCRVYSSTSCPVVTWGDWGGRVMVAVERLMFSWMDKWVGSRRHSSLSWLSIRRGRQMLVTASAPLQRRCTRWPLHHRR